MNYKRSIEFEQKILLFSLKAKIKGLSLQIKELKNKLKKIKKHYDVKGSCCEVDEYQILINRLARESRHHLLAYNLLRGIPYSCKEKNRTTKPNPQIVLNIVKQHASLYKRDLWTLEVVEAILNTEHQVKL